LLHEAGHRDFRDARGPLGFTQRQAAGKFSRDEADAFIQQLQDEADQSTVATQASSDPTIAVVVDDAVSAADLAGAIRAAGGALLADARLFDVYRGGQLPPGKKSVAFSLAFQAADRTLTDAEVADAKARIVETVSRRLGARLRG